MIVGTGLLANAFSSIFQDISTVTIYAAGVSNSQCLDINEFKRERDLLISTIKKTSSNQKIVYFGTCSVSDPTSISSLYVQHKLAMEQLVQEHSGYLIFRLPQIAAKTNNPHTLLNAIARHLVNGEIFTIWKHAYRNIIDIDDVLKIVVNYINDPRKVNIKLNIANPICYPILDIIDCMEKITKRKLNTIIKERGAHYPIDVTEMIEDGHGGDTTFSVDYLERVLRKYYAG